MDKKKIGIVLGIILMVITAVIIVVILNKKESQEENSSTIVDIDSVITEINELNNNFKKENLSQESSFSSKEGLSCYEYQKDNIIEIVDAINKLYEKTGNNEEGFIFRYYQETDDENDFRFKIFVCFQPNSEIIEIKDYKIISKKKDELKIIFNGNEDKQYIFHTDANNNGKFDSPILTNK